MDKYNEYLNELKVFMEKHTLCNTCKSSPCPHLESREKTNSLMTTALSRAKTADIPVDGIKRLVIPNGLLVACPDYIGNLSDNVISDYYSDGIYESRDDLIDSMFNGL